MILNTGICDILRREKTCSLEKQQQKEEKSVNRKVMRSKQATESYLATARNGMFENNIAADNMKELSEDQLLIHGVIDNFIEFDEDIVIYDYKTDRYKPYANMTKEKQIEQIVNKYRFQISLYSKALTIAYNKPIRQAYIVLLDFGVSIPIDTMYQL